MKVLLISVKSEKSKGGIAVWTRRYLEQCGIRGVDCKLVNTEVIGRRATQGTGRRSLADEWFRTKRIFRDLRVCLKERFEVAHLNTSCGTFGLFRDYLVARRIHKKGIPLVVHFHCDIPYWIHNPISRRCLGKLVALSCCNLVLCENSRKYLQEHFDAESEKVPNFIEDSLILPAGKQVAQTMRKVVFLGRVEEAKGAAQIYQLAERFPELEFRLIGEVSDRVREWKKTDNIILEGTMPHEQALKCLDTADLFLFPSHSEGFSLALLEAMARGLPSVATDVGANADMLSHGCGVIVAKGDVDAMEQAIRRSAPQKVRREMSENALQRVRTAYTTDAVFERIMHLYRR